MSEDVDKRLEDNLDKPIKLRPDEWKSGDVLWVIAVVGDSRLLGAMLQNLQQNLFEGKAFKIRQTDKYGKIEVRMFEPKVA